jgi:hypothetical protein
MAATGPVKTPAFSGTVPLPTARFYSCLVGTSDFDVQMSGIKFWKGDGNLKPVHKKPFYEILLRVCLHFGLFSL